MRVGGVHVHKVGLRRAGFRVSREMGREEEGMRSDQTIKK